MRSIYIFLLNLLISNYSFAQNIATAEINIRIENRTYSRLLFVDIKRSSENIQIEYKVKVGENNIERERDSNTIKARDYFFRVKNISPTNDTLITVLNTLDSIYIAYTIFKSDSLILSRTVYYGFDSLIDEIFYTPNDSLAISSQSYLDVTDVTFSLTKEKMKRVIYTKSPNSNTNPLLSKIIEDAMKYYRDIKMNDFLDKKNTAGY